MSALSWLAPVLLVIAVAFSLMSSLAVVFLGDTYQRMHHTSVVASVPVAFVTAAIWLKETAMQARIKAVLVFLILFGMNSVLSHVTARAQRLRTHGRLGAGES